MLRPFSLPCLLPALVGETYADAMSDFQSIILCANPRSGSTMLCDLMASTGVLGRPASFYRPRSIPDWAERLGIDKEAGSEEFERAYLAAIRQHETDASGMFGLRLMWDSVEGLVGRLSKLFPDQQSNAALFETAFDRPLYIGLVREDKVAQAVSLVRAKQSGQWHLSSDGSVRQGRKTSQPISYDAQAIENEIAGLTRDDTAWQTWFERQNVTPLQVTYEDLATDPQTVVAQILTASGHNPALSQNVQPVTAKMADEESRQWMARYRQEIC
ncbi:MAG: Stf0 family sulfotransferase [Parvibaculaceae bacterium]|nr:Stf0 family sulfotransferase [Parvibaculaceae bacterium]